VLRAIDALDLPDRIHRLGYVAEDELPPLLYGARLFCFVSLYEGFGLPVLEAQAAGVPVMTANNSSLPEVAGDAAILVDPTDVDAIADAMLRLSSDEALRQRLIAAGHANVARFSWQKAARETLAVLLKAAQAKSGQAMHK
jgi:glycosyltransferase involved in cell wall biosynthesis